MTAADFWSSIGPPVPDPEWTGQGSGRDPHGPAMAAVTARGLLDAPNLAAIFDDAFDRLWPPAQDWDSPFPAEREAARATWRAVAGDHPMTPDWSRAPEAERVAVAYYGDGPNRRDPGGRGVLLAPTLAMEAAALLLLDRIEAAARGTG